MFTHVFLLSSHYLCIMNSEVGGLGLITAFKVKEAVLVNHHCQSNWI